MLISDFASCHYIPSINMHLTLINDTKEQTCLLLPIKMLDSYHYFVHYKGSLQLVGKSLEHHSHCELSIYKSALQ